MSIKVRLIILSFLEFFIWGAWLISIGGYLFNTLQFSGLEIGKVFAASGIASLIMPTLAGIAADKYLNAEKLLGILHLAGAIALVFTAQQTSFDHFYPAILTVCLLFLPTISLSYAISYSVLAKNSLDSMKEFPKIKVWGTVGFITALWITDLAEFSFTNQQFYLAAIASAVLGIYSFTLPEIEISNTKKGNRKELLGLDALVIFKEPKMFVFFIFTVLIGCCLQITNAYGKSFIDDFKNFPEYIDAFAVRRSGIIISISQISETLFILAIPFFLKKFGIKIVMIISIIAWALRFGLFMISSPSGLGLAFLVGSMIIYGMAFDFFLISGSLYIEKESPHNIRSSAQGLFMMASNGLGAIIGGYASGLVVDHFTYADGTKNWFGIWSTFTVYALILSILFPIFFRYKSKARFNESRVKG